MPALQELSVAIPLMFSGDDGDKNSLTPAQFLLELDAKKVKSGWDDATTLQYATSCFRGYAHHWWTYSLTTTTSHAERTHAKLVKSNYDEFCKEFKTKFFLGGATKVLFWPSILSQRKGETAYHFYNRATVELTTFVASSRDEDTNKLLPAADTTEIVNTGADAQAKATLGGLATDLIQTYSRGVMDNLPLIYNTLVCRHLLIDGLRDKEVRKKAMELREKHESTGLLWTMIDRFEHSLQHKFEQSAPVFNIEQQQQEDVNAIRQRQQQQAAAKEKKKQQQQQPRQPNAEHDPNSWCSHCARKGHQLANCRTKKAKDKRNAAKMNAVTLQQQQPPPPTQANAIAAGMEGLQLSTQQLQGFQQHPGNAQGW